MSNQIQKITDECLQCGTCVKKCEYLSHYCKESPLDLTKRFLSGELKDDIPALFTCNLCSLCHHSRLLFLCKTVKKQTAQKHHYHSRKACRIFLT